MDGVQERQALGSLHDAEHELPGDAPGLLVHAEPADVIPDFAFAMDAHGGQITEDDGQVPVDERPDLAGKASTTSAWSISASMARRRCWWVTPPGIAGIATVSSQRRQPSFYPGRTAG